MACFGQCCWCREWNRPQKEDLLFRIFMIWSHPKLLLLVICVLGWKAEHLVFCQKENQGIGDPNKWTSIFLVWPLPNIQPSGCGLQAWTGPWLWRPHRPGPPDSCHRPTSYGVILHRPQDWLWCPHDHQSSFTFMMQNLGKNLPRLEPVNIIL